jgi:hypothetical protein
MRLEDLKADVAFGAAVDEVMDRAPRLRDVIARRVADLYEGNEDEGIRASALFTEIQNTGEGAEQGTVTAFALFRYLFGEDT